MSSQSLTAGAARALQSVEVSTQTQGATSSGTLPVRLLMVLYEEDCLAAEILKEAGFSSDEQLEQAGSSATASASFPGWKNELVREADRMALRSDSIMETGTEHLLLALMESDLQIAERLGQLGLTVESLLQRLAPNESQMDASSLEPIQIRPAEVGTIETAGLYRILDASSNRCREGLRAIEDYVRFHLDDQPLTRVIKELRHHVTQTLVHLGQPHWAPLRDTPGDVGTGIRLQSERERGTLVDVVRAACKRAEEALRTLEEFGKLIDHELSDRLTHSRYRLYELERLLELRWQARERLADCSVCFLATSAECRIGIHKTVPDAIAAGVQMVQIREKNLPDRQLARHAEAMRKVIQRAGALCLVNDRADIAAAVGADGVHLGQDDLDVAQARRILGGEKLIGVSTHSIEQARNAVRAGADYLGVGPVFSSSTKSFDVLAGLEFVRQAAREIPIPWFAIGGIDTENLAEVIAAGAKQVAVSSIIGRAGNPRQPAAELVKRLAAVRGPSMGNDLASTNEVSEKSRADEP